MKMILLAAAAVIAMPAIAQTTTPNNPTTPVTPGQALPDQQSTQPQPAAPQQGDPSMPMPAQSGQAMPNSPTTDGSMPTQPAMGTPPAPGQTPTFQQPQDVNTAFPPPPAETGPLPYCKAGQYDKCREHSTASGARSHRTKR